MSYITKVVDLLSEKIRSHGFLFYKEYKSEKRIEYIYELDDVKYVFSVLFIKSYRCIGTIACYQKSIQDYLKIIDKKEGKKVPTALSELKYFVSEKNIGELFYSNDDVAFEFDKDDSVSLENLALQLYEIYFLKGVVKFMENTDTIKKLDELVNLNPIFETKKMNLHFAGVPHELTIGLLSAWLTKNPKLHILIDKYSDLTREECNLDLPIVKFYFKTVEFINNNIFNSN